MKVLGIQSMSSRDYYLCSFQEETLDKAKHTNKSYKGGQGLHSRQGLALEIHRRKRLESTTSDKNIKRKEIGQVEG